MTDRAHPWNPLPVLAAKDLDDGTYMLAVGFGSKVVLLHYVIRELTIEFRDIAHQRFRGVMQFHQDGFGFEPKIDNCLLNTVIISRQEFDAGGYEEKARRREGSPQLQKTSLLVGPEGY